MSISLKKCSICSQQFPRSLALSQHLNIHGVQWKAYWDMYLHHVSGLTCNLCDSTHADVYSLESHLKMKHCIKSADSPPRVATVSGGVERGRGTSRGDAGTAEITEDSTPSRAPTTPGDRRTAHITVKEVRVLTGGRGRVVAQSRPSRSNRTLVIGRDGAGNLTESAPVLPQPVPGRRTVTPAKTNHVHGSNITTNPPTHVQKTTEVPASGAPHAVPPRPSYGPSAPRNVNLATFVPPVMSQSRIPTTEPSVRVPQPALGPSHPLTHPCPPNPGPSHPAVVGMSSDEVTEVGRVVTVPLDGAPTHQSDIGSLAYSTARSRRKRKGGRTKALEIIEVLDVDRTSTVPTEGATTAGSNPPSGERLPPPSRDAAMSVRGRTPKPTAVVSPYGSERERPQQPASSGNSGPSSSSGGTKLPTPTDHGQTSSDAWRHPPRTPTEPERVGLQSAAVPPSSGLQFAAVPPSSGLQSAAVNTRRSEPAAPPPVSAPAASTAPPPPVSASCTAAPPLLPWLDSVYRPGTLTRLGEQAAALTRRPDSPGGGGGTQLRRLVDRSQRLRVDNQVTMARDPSGNPVPVLRLLTAAAETDQLVAGTSSGDRPATDPSTEPGAGHRAQSGPGTEKSTSAVHQRQAADGVSQSLPGTGLQGVDARTGSGSINAALGGLGNLDSGYGSTELYVGDDILPPGGFKTEPNTAPIPELPELPDANTYLTMDQSLKEEQIAFHPSVGIDSGPAVEQPPLYDGADVDLVEGPGPLGVKTEPTVEVKTETTVVGLADGRYVSLDDSADSQTVELFDLPGADDDDDPLAVTDDMAAVGSQLAGVPSALSLESIEDLTPVPPTPPAPPAARGRRGPGRPPKRPTLGRDVSAETAGGGRPGGAAGDRGPTSARQETGARRRRRGRGHNWDAKKKKGNRPLFTKPEG